MTRWADRRAYLRPYEQPELWVSAELECCYVVNPKVACSSIQVALTEAATGQTVTGFRHNHPLVGSFRRTRFRDVPSHYFCFTFVRHPFDRVVSFYKDKFLRPRQEGREFDYASYLGGVFRQDDSFEQVCAAIARIPDRLSDRHFVSQGFWLDRVCGARLDHVGRLESLAAEWPGICRRIGRKAELPRLNSSADIPFAPKVPAFLNQRYAADFDRFSYAP